MALEKRILITGGHSSVAKAAKKLLAADGYKNVACPDRSEMDLTDISQVKEFFQSWRPDCVLHIAARTATAKENRETPWDIFRDNLLIEYHVFEAAVEAGVGKTIWVSSDSAFPFKESRSIQHEGDLLQGPLKKDIEPYAFAKLAGLKMCEYLNRQKKDSIFISLLPCYIYGSSKKGLLYALVKDFVLAKKEGRKTVQVWGKGCQQYRFIHSWDVASAMLFVMQNRMKYDEYIIAPTKAIAKLKLASQIADCVGYDGEIIFDGRDSIQAPANASPERLCEEGWCPTVPLKHGIKELAEQLFEELK